MVSSDPSILKMRLQATYPVASFIMMVTKLGEPVNYPVSCCIVFVSDKPLLYPRNILVIGDALTSTLKPSIRKGLARSLQNSFELSSRPDGLTPKKVNREQIIAKTVVIEGLWPEKHLLSTHSHVEVWGEKIATQTKKNNLTPLNTASRGIPSTFLFLCECPHLHPPVAAVNNTRV